MNYIGSKQTLLPFLFKSAEKPIKIVPAEFEVNPSEHRVFCEDANTLVKKTSFYLTTTRG